MFKSQALKVFICVVGGLFVSSCGPPAPQSIQPEITSPPPLRPEDTISNQLSTPPPLLPEPLKGNAVPDIPPSDAGNIGLSSSLGLRTNKLFNFPVFDERKRFERLERAVQDVRDDLDEVLPIIKTQLAVQGDLKGLITKLNAMVPAAGLPTAALENNSPSPIARSENTPKAQGPTLLNIRAANHSDKVRFVLETAEKPNFSVNLDASNKILRIHSSGEYQDNLENRSFKVDYLRKAIFKREKNGYTISIATGNLGAVQNNFTIKPNKDNQNYRTVIDLGK